MKIFKKIVFDKIEKNAVEKSWLCALELESTKSESKPGFNLRDLLSYLNGPATSTRPTLAHETFVRMN